MEIFYPGSNKYKINLVKLLGKYLLIRIFLGKQVRTGVVKLADCDE